MSNEYSRIDCGTPIFGKSDTKKIRQQNDMKSQTWRAPKGPSILYFQKLMMITALGLIIVALALSSLVNPKTKTKTLIKSETC